MRFKKGLLNSIIGIIVMVLTGVFSMIKISVIISNFGNEINGFNNVISQIFNFLMIGEAGLGLATTTLLYKPIAEEDNNTVNKLVAGSQVTISIIVVVILLATAFISLFIPLFIKGNNLSSIFISIAFLLFAIKALIPQLNQPIKSYAMANQDEYYVNSLRGISVILINITEIYFIVSGYNYLLVLISGVFVTSITELISLGLLKRKYKFIELFNKEKDFSASGHMKELVRVNIVSTVAKSIDPIVISKFIGLVATSFYSNYSYIQNFLQSIIGTLLGSVTHMFGDIFAKKENDVYEKFNMYIMLSNFIASISAIMFYALIQLFIPIWIGKEALLENKTALLFSILIYMYSAMRPMNTLIIANGFFKLASNSAIYETIINITLSVLLVYKFGVIGVLIASVISFVCASFWYFPVKTYKKVFDKSYMEYFQKQIYSIIILSIMFALINIILYYANIEAISFINFFCIAIVFGIVVSIVSFAIYFIVFEDFRRLTNFIKSKIIKRK